MILPVDKTQIVISNDGIKPVDKESFSGEILNNSNFKIYILKLTESYLYIGKTKQKIGDKFRQGFRSYRNDLKGKREAGYGGYKWIKKYINTDEILQLYVFDLGKSCTDNNAEAIEAEIVFDIRNNFSKWPECQNEIHFFNDYENATVVAHEILKITND